MMPAKPCFGNFGVLGRAYGVPSGPKPTADEQLRHHLFADGENDDDLDDDDEGEDEDDDEDRDEDEDKDR